MPLREEIPPDLVCPSSSKKTITRSLAAVLGSSGNCGVPLGKLGPYQGPHQGPYQAPYQGPYQGPRIQ